MCITIIKSLLNDICSFLYETDVGANHPPIGFQMEAIMRSPSMEFLENFRSLIRPYKGPHTLI